MTSAATKSRQRLDQHLVDAGHFATRSRARDAIVRGTVSVDGVLAAKPSLTVAADCAITIDDPAQAYVSRAALKLVAGLDAFSIDVTGRIALDVGASTGGFTQVLLERGAARVHAIDVGHDQLHDSLRNDPRVAVREGLNARDLTSADLDGDAPSIIVSDVSFISLTLALPPALSLAAPGAISVLLVKPQFEVGRSKIGKGGLVSVTDGEACAQDLRDWLHSFPGWHSTGLIASPLTGGDGNHEFLLAGRKDG